jgi:uncharacterized protein (DUF58 family)
MRLTRKSFVFLALALLSLFAGMIWRNPTVVLVPIPLVAYLIVSLILASEGDVLQKCTPFSSSSSKVVVNRKADKLSIYEDESSEITLDVINQGERIEFLEVLDLVPKGLELSSGSNHHVISLERDEKFSFSYTLKPQVYGQYLFGPLLLRISDTQNLIVEERMCDSSSLTLTVIPKITYVPKINIRPKKAKNWPGEIVANKLGSGMEFYSLRNYMPGDPVKRINWKASARTRDVLFTNQFMSELGGDTIIALDARTVAEIGPKTRSTLVYSIRAAAIVAHRLLRDRNRVGMIVLGSMLEKVQPGFGKRQLDRILIALSRTKPADIWEIRALGSYLSQFFSTMVQVVFISPLTDERAFESVVDVATRGYRVLVISPSPIDVEKIAFSQSKLRRTIARDHNDGADYDDMVSFRVAEQLLRVKRKNKLDRLREIAVVVDWDVSLPFSQALQEATYLWNKSVMG